MHDQWGADTEERVDGSPRTSDQIEDWGWSGLRTGDSYPHELCFIKSGLRWIGRGRLSFLDVFGAN